MNVPVKSLPALRQSMKLENQENREERLNKAVEMKAGEIIDKMPKYLWD